MLLRWATETKRLQIGLVQVLRLCEWRGVTEIGQQQTNKSINIYILKYDYN